jgi:hypothetical protein
MFSDSSTGVTPVSTMPGSLLSAATQPSDATNGDGSKNREGLAIDDAGFFGVLDFIRNKRTRKGAAVPFDNV